MPPKSIGKAVSKKCPDCKKQNAVATRICSCSYRFFEERRKSTASNTSEHEEPIEEVTLTVLDLKDPLLMASGSSSPMVEGGKRRSERVKREKPNFYDAMEYDNKMRKARKERQKDDPGIARGKREKKMKLLSEIEDADEDEKNKGKKKKHLSNEKEEEIIDEDIMAGITPDKEWQFSMVLSDINMKMGLNNPMLATAL